MADPTKNKAHLYKTPNVLDICTFVQYICTFVQITSVHLYKSHLYKTTAIV